MNGDENGVCGSEDDDDVEYYGYDRPVLIMVMMVILKIILMVAWFLCFNGVSTFMGYLMLKLSL